GRIPYFDLSRYLNLIDICLSTQTNDVAGQARTTGKLPLYLACGRYVLASRVGEASLLLSDDMLIEYEGTKDAAYPRKLAQRVREIVEGASIPNDNRYRGIAEQYFDYTVLSQKLNVVLQSA